MTARLQFEVCGGRTALWRQHVPYPVHVTRPFYLDAGAPNWATLYLQSASGGLYRGDRIALEVEAGPGARAHVTTQAATVVHDTRRAPARQRCRIVAAPDARLAFTPDPFILFPGAALQTETEVVLAPGASVIVADAFAWHDPGGKGRRFSRYASSTVIRAPCGTVLATDRSAIGGEALGGPASPLGPWQTAACVMLLGHGTPTDAAELIGSVEQARCLAGASALPNRAGLAVRMLAASGGDLARGLSLTCLWAIEHSFGVRPAPRPK